MQPAVCRRFNSAVVMRIGADGCDTLYISICMCSVVLSLASKLAYPDSDMKGKHACLTVMSWPALMG